MINESTFKRFGSIILVLLCFSASLYFSVPALKAHLKTHKDETVLLSYFSKFYFLEQVKSVRQAFDDYLAENRPTFMQANRFTSYYSSPFKVTDIRRHPFGGEVIRLYFTDNFDRFFDVWIYQIDTNSFEIRSIDKVDMPKEKFDPLKKKLAFYTQNPVLAAPSF